MKKRILTILCVLTLCVSLLSVGMNTLADTAYEYTMLQDFESDNIGTDCYTFSQFQSSNVLTYAKATAGVAGGAQAVQVTVSAQYNNGDNFYPALAADKKDWTGYDGLVFYYKAGDCPVVHSGGAEVGRFDITLQLTSGTRYTASNTTGPIYFLEDGASAETTLLVAGDNRYIMPNKSGYVRMPFSSLTGWSEAVDMATMHEMFLWIAADAYTGNNYYFDAVQLYKAIGNSDGGEGGEGNTPDDGNQGEGEGEVTLDPVLLQGFESANAGENAYTFSQFQGAGNEVLTYVNVTDVKNSGDQSLKLTVSKEGPGWDNFYPVISSKTDWSGYNELTIHFTPGDCANVYNENEVGRIEFAVDTTTGTRFAANAAVGNLYFLADGAEEEVALEVAADGRYKLPNKAGTIRIPFTSLTGWTATKDMSSMKEMFLGFATADYVGNVYYFDTVTLCVAEDSDGGDSGEEEVVPPLMIQNFEKNSAGACMYPWTDGAGVTLALEEGIGVDGSKAGKLTIGAPNGSQVSMVLYVLLQNTDLSAGQTLMFYAENPQTDEDGYVSLAFTLEEKSGERWGVGSNKKFYLVGLDGEVEEVRNGSDMRMVIPAGFKGWIVVPERSLSLHMNSLQDGERDLSDLNSLLIDAAADMMEGKTIYLDNICMSELSATEVLEQLAPDHGDNSGENAGPGDSNAGNNDGNNDSNVNDTPADNTPDSDSPATGENVLAVMLAAVALMASVACLRLLRKKVR
ncbi:MAG: hypothetical protein IJ518_05390 [Clostridia bacterium]|nr:hypothetical protein [Clostridia bacterium]